MRWVLGIVGVLVVVVLVVGALLPKPHVAAMSARYVAPPESLWVTLTDVNAFPTWRRDLERALDIFGRAVAWARIPICQTLVLAATSIARKYLRGAAISCPEYAALSIGNASQSSHGDRCIAESIIAG